MKKHEVRTCKCGCVHFVPWSDIETAIDHDKEFVMICNRCGTALRYGAEDYMSEGKALYCFPLAAVEITKERFDAKFTKILYSEGKRVPMKTGQFADFYDGNTFYDCQPHFWSSKLYEYKTIEEIRNYYERQNELAKQVNVERFMNSLTSEEKESLAHYYIKAFRTEE